MMDSTEDFMVLGCILLWASAWIATDGGIFEYNIGVDLNNYYDACYTGLAVGVILLAIGFIGCLAVALDSPCLLIVTSALHVICFILELTICALVWRVAGGDRLQYIYELQIRGHMEQRNTNDTSRRFLDLIQLKLECCGAYAFVDYREMNQDIPASCNSDRTNNVHITSCAENLRRYMEIRGGLLGGVAASLMLVQIFMFLLNFCFCYGMRIEDRHAKQIRHRNF
ncbi:CD9 antigen-like protein [Leptotrombidium deliense]|uniref:Tetraspanin n=1 Tax=Leptotrombidium deliense TaxID=299467 RepID=A0A443SPC1_9ACAR|nr:CD9 antigen-like protein [Leptotrombidium deliense]